MFVEEIECSCIWDIRTQKVVSTLKAPAGSGAILDCAYVKETGTMLAGSFDGSLCQWSGSLVVCWIMVWMCCPWIRMWVFYFLIMLCTFLIIL